MDSGPPAPAPGTIMAGWDPLACPVCGDASIEQRGPARLGGTEESAVTVQPDRDEYEPGNPLGGRGGYTAIRLFCSSGHGFDIVTANHKGQQRLAVIYAGPRCWGWDE